jgi:hypothetical protein
VKDTVRPAVRANRESANFPPPVTLPSRVAGTYEITPASRVYAAPSESSQPIGDIEPGVKVSVVNRRDGWLEIHSKHGRPPGFIRTEVAARVAAQN